MARFRIVVPRPVVKDFAKLNKKTLGRLSDALNDLAKNPFSRVVKGKKVKKLRTSVPVYGLRVNQYRLLYHVNSKMIVLLGIVHRKDLEKELKKMM